MKVWAVSDQRDLPQHQGRLLLGNERGCLRSDNSSTATRVAAVQQWTGLSQISLTFINTRAGVDVVSDQLDLSQYQVCLLVNNEKGCLRTDRSSTAQRMVAMQQ